MCFYNIFLSFDDKKQGTRITISTTCDYQFQSGDREEITLNSTIVNSGVCTLTEDSNLLNPPGNCMSKVNSKNTRTRCKHISHLVIVFLLLTLNRLGRS